MTIPALARISLASRGTGARLCLHPASVLCHGQHALSLRVYQRRRDAAGPASALYALLIDTQLLLPTRPRSFLRTRALLSQAWQTAFLFRYSASHPHDGRTSTPGAFIRTKHVHYRNWHSADRLRDSESPPAESPALRNRLGVAQTRYPLSTQGGVPSTAPPTHARDQDLGIGTRTHDPGGPQRLPWG